MKENSFILLILLYTNGNSKFFLIISYLFNYYIYEFEAFKEYEKNPLIQSK
jgi:hypothetical protein